MRWLPWGLTGILATAVAVLATLLIRQGNAAREPPASPPPAGPQIDRVAEAEATLGSLDTQGPGSTAGAAA